MAVIGNKYLQGIPVLPFANVKAYPDTDVYLDLAFLDHNSAPVVPTSIQVELDDLTNCQVMAGPYTFVSGGNLSGQFIYGAFSTEMILQIAASVMQMTFPYEGSQQCQLKMKFTAVDTVTGLPFSSAAPIAVIELCADSSVTGF